MVALYNESMKKITVSASSFEDLRTKGDSVYVDKTECVYELVRHELNNYYFLSRPFGFGKSLMCSTLQALFEGKRELFKGLYIDSTDYSFEKFPVLHFNFADIDASSYANFLRSFQECIIKEAKENEVKVERGLPSEMLMSILRRSKKKVAVIIDEYDAPLIQASGNNEVADRIKMVFGTFYAIIKNSDDKIRFCFVTGVTPYSAYSPISEMNNLTNITFRENFATAFGYTEEELESNFSEFIDAYMSRTDREYEKREDFIEAVRNFYGGYKFTYESEVKLYNSASVGSFFNGNCCFNNYWNDTEASSLAVNLARGLNLDFDNARIDVNSIVYFDYLQLATAHNFDSYDVLTLMYFAGYLTIKEGTRNVLTLSFPNTEVRTFFAKSLADK